MSTASHFSTGALQILPWSTPTELLARRGDRVVGVD